MFNLCMYLFTIYLRLFISFNSNFYPRPLNETCDNTKLAFIDRGTIVFSNGIFHGKKGRLILLLCHATHVHESYDYVHSNIFAYITVIFCYFE